VDQEVKKGDIDRARALLERGTALSLPAKKMKAIFKKYLEVEKEHGDEESVERVKAKAFDFVERSL
jgi:rRNA biogenesis protein RRP5